MGVVGLEGCAGVLSYYYYTYNILYILYIIYYIIIIYYILLYYYILILFFPLLPLYSFPPSSLLLLFFRSIPPSHSFYTCRYLHTLTYIPFYHPLPHLPFLPFLFPSIPFLLNLLFLLPNIPSSHPHSFYTCR